MTAPFLVLDVDLERALAGLRARFPEALVWYGEATGALWAAVRDGRRQWRLIEGGTIAALGQQLEQLRQSRSRAAAHAQWTPYGQVRW